MDALHARKPASSCTSAGSLSTVVLDFFAMAASPRSIFGQGTIPCHGTEIPN
jgi:hypothetical protein